MGCWWLLFLALWRHLSVTERNACPCMSLDSNHKRSLLVVFGRINFHPTKAALCTGQDIGYLTFQVLYWDIRTFKHLKCHWIYISGWLCDYSLLMVSIEDFYLVWTLMNAIWIWDSACSNPQLKMENEVRTFPSFLMN